MTETVAHIFWHPQVEAWQVLWCGLVFDLSLNPLTPREQLEKAAEEAVAPYDIPCTHIAFHKRPLAVYSSEH